MQAMIGKIFSCQEISQGNRIWINNLSSIPYALSAIGLILHSSFELKILKLPSYYYTLLYSAMEQKKLCCVARLLKGICDYIKNNKKEHVRSFQQNIKIVWYHFFNIRILIFNRSIGKEKCS